MHAPARNSWQPRKQESTVRRHKYAVNQGMIISVFRRCGKEVKASGNNYVLAQCLWHPDNGPSLSITANGHRAKCFNTSCPSHEDPKDWIDICEVLGVQDGLVGTDSDGGERVTSLSYRLRSLRDNTQRLVSTSIRGTASLPQGSRPWKASDGSWRGLPAEYLMEREAHVWSDKNTRVKRTKKRIAVDRLVLPVKHNATSGLVGWVAEAIEMKYRKGKMLVDPKCRNMPTMKAERVLFGLDVALQTAGRAGLDGIVLVEGPYDQLRSHYYGLPSAALLGTGTWDTKPGRRTPKARLLIEAGITMVYTLMDGDEAGDACAQVIKDDMEDWMKVRCGRLPRGKDPGRCSPRVFEKVLRRLGLLSHVAHDRRVP